MLSLQRIEKNKVFHIVPIKKCLFYSVLRKLECEKWLIFVVFGLITLDFQQNKRFLFTIFIFVLPPLANQV